VTSYISFVPFRTVRRFPNEKPRVTSDLKKLLNLKKDPLWEGGKKYILYFSQIKVNEDHTDVILDRDN